MGMMGRRAKAKPVKQRKRAAIQRPKSARRKWPEDFLITKAPPPAPAIPDAPTEQS
jgi:hypothetical protein